MSTELQVGVLLAEAEGNATARAVASLTTATQEVRTILGTSKCSFAVLCANMEKAKSRAQVKAAFKEFNAVVRILLEAAPGEQFTALVRDSLCSFKLSARLREALLSTSPVSVALIQYKEAIATGLAVAMRARATGALLYDEKDDEILLRLLPQPSPPNSDDGPHVLGSMPKKRVFSAIDDLPIIPKKTSVPALASLSRVQELIGQGSLTKKQALLTREKLRAGTHDPRGLLKMVGSSTNALERAKQMEILKCSGYGLDETKKSQGKISFADKLQMARTRLELGLGGHALSDTLLFGAKVLSTPGVLTPKNISDIENNIVGGKTT